MKALENGKDQRTALNWMRCGLLLAPACLLTACGNFVDILQLIPVGERAIKILFKIVMITILCFTANSVLAADCSEANAQIAPHKKNPKELRQLLDKHPGCGEIWEALGDYFYEREVWDEAGSHYEQALKYLPEKSKLINRLQEIRPRMTALLKSEQDVLEFRRQIGGKTNLPAGERPTAKAPAASAVSTESGPVNVASSILASSHESVKVSIKDGPVKVASTPHVKAQPVQSGGKKVALSINFKSKSAEIAPDGKKLLDTFADVLKDELRNKKFNVLGHTDNIGSREYNMELSRMRANSVKAYLSDAGVDPKRMTVRGLGFESPIYDNDTESGRAKNRRVEFEIL